MSIGAWAVGVFGGFTFVSSVLSFTSSDSLASLRRKISLVGMLFGFFLAGYTGVLLSNSAMPFWGVVSCFAPQQVLLWQQLRPDEERSLQQLQPQQVVAPKPPLIVRQAAARHDASRWPSAQMQAIWGNVPRKNAGSTTSERILSR